MRRKTPAPAPPTKRKRRMPDWVASTIASVVFVGVVGGTLVASIPTTIAEGQSKVETLTRACAAEGVELVNVELSVFGTGSARSVIDDRVVDFDVHHIGQRDIVTVSGDTVALCAVEDKHLLERELVTDCVDAGIYISDAAFDDRQVYQAFDGENILDATAITSADGTIICRTSTAPTTSKP